MADVDPFVIPIPRAFTQDPETRAFFEYFIRWAHDMWQRSGAGDDYIEEITYGDLYEYGVDTGRITELDKRLCDLEIDFDTASHRVDVDQKDEDVLRYALMMN